MIDFTLFFQEQQRLIESIPYQYKRYLYEQIDWDARSLLITGQRGSGKTTMILQHLKEHYRDDTSALYISVDNPYFKNISLYEFAMEFEKFGGEVLYIDEIH
jgi:predicted AAA+ superfamily ATPase